MDYSNNDITNLATLTFLTNPLYSKEMSNTSQDIVYQTTEDRKFYKKRLYALHKQLMHGDIVDNDIKKAHDAFIRVSIDFFKMIDKKDILQTEYDGQTLNTPDPPPSFDIDLTNTKIMRRLEEPKCTLDNFVTSKIVNFTKPPPPPKKKNINLKDEKLKKKGIKKKKHKLET